jgi:hypothetical protein
VRVELSQYWGGGVVMGSLWLVCRGGQVGSCHVSSLKA